MLFNSYTFIFYFLPITFGGYYLFNHFKQYRLANLFLTFMSIIFYGYNNVSYVWIILCSILLNYIIHVLLLSDSPLRRKYKKSIVLLGILSNLGILFYFKYFNFTLEIFSGVTGMDITFSKIALPLGISFFTFQQVGFIVDSYKGVVSRQNPVSYSLFVSFFPQLVAGPIVDHDEMLPQFEDVKNRKINPANLYLGARAFIFGLAKKVLIADTLGKAVNWGYQYYSFMDGFNTALVILMYSLQLYYDFSGYCDMARGLGYLFNIRIPLNFNSPFKSKNLVEFWKRWHMTLGRFFTRYVYIPLGGNRRGFVRGLVNIFAVFFISGIWHGAGWTFILWGLLHAIMQVLTRIWWRIKDRCHLPSGKNPVLRKSLDFLSITGCFAFVALAFSIFRADDLSHAMALLSNLTKFSGLHIMTEISSVVCFDEFSYLLKFLNLDQLTRTTQWQLIAFLVVTALLTWGSKNVYETEKDIKPRTIGTLCLTGLFLWSLVSLSGVSTFLYFNF